MMRVCGPSGSPFGGWSQAAPCCGGREAVVVSDRGKGAVEVSGGDQEGVALKAPVLVVAGGAFTVRGVVIRSRRHRNRGAPKSLGWAWRLPGLLARWCPA